MRLIKKFLIFNIAIAPPSFLIQKQLSSRIYEPSKWDILNIYNSNLSQNITLSSHVDENVNASKNKFVYSLFSTNLTTFSKKLTEYFYKWFLFKWGDELLQEGSDTFLQSKIAIFNEFKKNYNSYSYNLKELNPQNWSKENSVLSTSNTKLSEEFEKIFFEKIYLKNGSGQNVEFAVDETDKQQGAENYKKIISNFQKFVYKKWMEDEKPFLICKYDFKYTDKKPKIFNEEIEESKPKAAKPKAAKPKKRKKLPIPNKANFQFPDFKTKDEQWTQFIESIKNGQQKQQESQTKKQLCKESNISLMTLSKLLKIEDGYKVSALIHNNDLVSDTEKIKTINRKKQKKISNIKHPLDFFLKKKFKKEKKEKNQKNREWYWKIDKDLFKKNKKKPKAKKKKVKDFSKYEATTHISDIEIDNLEKKRAKRSLEKSDSKEYGTIARTNSGISFFLKKKEHKDIENFLTKYEKNIQKKNEKQKDSKEKKNKLKLHLHDELKEYFKKKPAQIIIEYFSKNRNSGLLKYVTHLSQYSIFVSAVNYLNELEKNQNYFKLISIFSKSSEPYMNLKMKKDTKKQKKYLPEKKAGLAVPIMFPKNLNNVHTDSEINLKNDYSTYENIEQQTKEYKNDGNIPELTEGIFGKLNKTKLHELAQALRRSIASWERFQNINQNKKLNTYFFNDYIFDSIFYDMKHDKNLFIKTITNIALLNNNKFNLFLNNTNTFSNTLSKEMTGSNDDQTELKKFIEQYILEDYYAKKYLNESPANRISYGGYEYKNPVIEEEEEQKRKKREVKEAQPKTKECVIKTQNQENKIFDQEVKAKEKEQKKDWCGEFLKKTKENWGKKIKNYWIEKHYFLNDYGYEISSDETTKYLSFLETLSWSIRDNYRNIKNFFKSKIPIGRFGTFVWIDEIKNSNWKSSNGKKYIGVANEHKNEKSRKKRDAVTQKEIPTTLRNRKDYFKDHIFNDLIFNPFFSTQMKVEYIEKNDFPSISDYSKAFAKTSDKQYTEFNGFKGFISERFNTEGIPKVLKDAIFKNFKSANPENNKSFNTVVKKEEEEESQKTQKPQYGLFFGSIFAEKDKKFEELIDQIKTLQIMKEYLEELPELIKTEYQKKRKLDDENTLQLLKTALKEAFSKKEKNMKNNPQFSRFSGFIQNPKQQDSINNQKYFIPKEKSKTEGYIVYITQLRRSDFDENWNELFKEISFRTFLKSIFMSSETEELQKRAVLDTLTKYGVFL